MFQELAVDEAYYQWRLKKKILEELSLQYPWEKFSLTGFICAGRNYFCVEDNTQNKKEVFNSNLEQMIDFCSDSISGCYNCVKPHIFEPQDIRSVESQIQINLTKILQSGNIKPKNDSFDELSKLAEKYVLVKLPPLEYLGHYAENNSEAEYNKYVKFLVKTALICIRILDYIKFDIKVVADRAYEEEFVEYQEKINVLLFLKQPKWVYEINMSRRLVSILLRADIYTLKDFKALSEEELVAIKGIGRKSLQELIEVRAGIKQLPL